MKNGELFWISLHLLHLCLSTIGFNLHMEGHPCEQGIQKVYFSSSREICYSWPRWALCGVKRAGQDKLWVLMWVLWALKCWFKISLKDTGFLEDTFGASLSRWGRTRPGGWGSPREVGITKAEPREGIVHTPSHSSNAGRRCQNSTCCDWIWEQCSSSCSKSAGWGPRGSDRAQQVGAQCSAFWLVQFS